MHDISLFAVDIKGHRFGFGLNPFVCTLCSVPVFISLWCSSLYMYGRHHPHAPLVHLIFLLWISWVFHVISLHYHLFSPYCFPTTFIPIMSRVLHQLPHSCPPYLLSLILAVPSSCLIKPIFLLPHIHTHIPAPRHAKTTPNSHLRFPMPVKIIPSHLSMPVYSYFTPCHSLHLSQNLHRTLTILTMSSPSSIFLPARSQWSPRYR